MNVGLLAFVIALSEGLLLVRMRSLANASCRIVAASSDTPPDIEALCQRFRISRRGLQNSFRQISDTTAVHYLRGLRLNLVRTRLMSTRQAQLSVSQAAADEGLGI